MFLNLYPLNVGWDGEERGQSRMSTASYMLQSTGLHKDKSQGLSMLQGISLNLHFKFSLLHYLGNCWGKARRWTVRESRAQFFFPLWKNAEAVCSCYCSSVLKLHLTFSHTPGTALTAFCEKESLEQASPPPAECCKGNSPSKGWEAAPTSSDEWICWHG